MPVQSSRAKIAGLVNDGTDYQFDKQTIEFGLRNTWQTRGIFMLYELRTYTVKPGSLGDMVKMASTLARDIRKDDYGTLEGYWLTEIGPLNQVVHLWSYADFNERARLRGALGKNSRWTGEYLPLIRPLMLRQDIRLLNALRPPLAPASAGNIYELRNYRAKPGGAVYQWLDAFTAALPAREKYSKIVGLWQTEAGQPNEVCHIWAYPSLNARTEARGNALKDRVLARIPRKGWSASRRDALDHHVACPALATEVRF